jgi:hypothetical protein
MPRLKNSDSEVGQLLRRDLECELRNQGSSGKYWFRVRLLDLKSLHELAAKLTGTSDSPHSSCGGMVMTFWLAGTALDRASALAGLAICRQALAPKLASVNWNTDAFSRAA